MASTATATAAAAAGGAGGAAGAVDAATPSQADDIESIVRHLWPIVEKSYVPELGIVCGSGLNHLADAITGANRTVIPYGDIPGFPNTTVKGHSGQLVIGELSGKKVIAAKGRFHFYEGHPAARVAITIRIMAALGCKAVIVTNAAGGVNPEFQVGDIAVIDDHVFMPGLAGNHPLVGPNDERFGPRFPAVNGVYAPDFQEVVNAVAAEQKIESRVRPKAVYGCVSGPSYETPHEIKLLRVVGVDQVGMSTIQEVVVAAHCGLKVLGLSLITNRCLAPGDTHTPPTHEEVLQAVLDSQPVVQALVKRVVEKLDLSALPITTGGKFFAKLCGSDKA